MNTYACEQVLQLKPEEGKTTVSFDKLVVNDSDISTAKDNVAEALNTSLCAMSSDRNKLVICGFCNKVFHNASGFTAEVRKKDCKAYGQTCNKC